MASLFLFALLPSTVAWSFTLLSTPIPCGYLELNITGGTEPYDFTVAHFPPPNSSETGSASAWSPMVALFWLSAPEGTDPASNLTFSTFLDSVFSPESPGTRFVVVGSDATGYGTGGVTEILTVGRSESDRNDPTCQVTYANTTTDPTWAFTDLPTSVGQCQPSALFAGNLTGPVTADLIVPGYGAVRSTVQSPYPNDTTFEGSDLPWSTIAWDVSSFPPGVDVALVLGYEGGVPALLSPLMTLQDGDTCSVGIPPNCASSSSSSNGGVIVGGVVGGVLGTLVLAALGVFLVRMYNRRRRREAQQTIRMSVWRHSRAEKLERQSWRSGYQDEPESAGEELNPEAATKGK